MLLTTRFCPEREEIDKHAYKMHLKDKERENAHKAMNSWLYGGDKGDWTYALHM